MAKRMRGLWRKSAPLLAMETPDVLSGVTRFLGGQMLESFGEDRESLPDWVWVSVLAHASEDVLAANAAEGGTSSRSSKRCVWDRTLSYLSHVLLDHAARTGEPVAQLQHEIVVPIELRLGARPLAPPTFVRLVLSGLEEREGSASAHPASTAERNS
jgi:hypothetical protein